MKFSRAFLYLSIALFPAGSTLAQFPPAPGTGPGLAETIEAIDSARVSTRILYITAHPDDESATLLTYLARGLHADVALLTLTRGEGGQNALGPEQAPQFGLIRTQELLAATRGYGVKLFFTRAPDFGYSKTPEETMKVWGDAVLGDMVRVIRTLRPNIVINGWGGVHGGHGHHQTSGLWTPRAVQLAADPKAFPEQIVEGLQPWGSDMNPVAVLDTERGGGTAGSALPVDDISPLWGKSYREIALDAFVNHRSQGIAGFLGSPFLRRPLTLIAEGGTKFEPAILDKPLHEIAGDSEGEGCRYGAAFCPGLREAEGRIAEAREAALHLEWKKSAESLAAAGQNVESLFHRAHWRGTEPLLQDLRNAQAKINRALALTAGLEVTARADKSELVAGESFQVSASARCRKESGCSPGELRIDLPKEMQESRREGDPGKGYQFTVHVGPPVPPSATQQALLPGLDNRNWERLLPEPRPLVFVNQAITIAGYSFEVSEPVIHIQASSTRVDRVLPRIVPAYTLAVEPKRAVEVPGNPRKPFDILLRLHSYATLPTKINVSLDVPEGWSSSAPQTLEFAGEGDKYARFTVTLPEKFAPGTYKIGAYAQRGDEGFANSLEPLPSLPAQLWSEPAECRVHAFDVSVPENLRVGYITAENEPIPEALARLGIRVEMLDAAALAFGDLSKFDAIVVGVRAYELRSDLASANQRLLDYVKNGGTLVVQYNRNFVWDRVKPSPYPATMGNDTLRITDETAAVTFLKPDDPLLNRPNKITQDDFQGWVQERGLYFWDKFDEHYTPLLAMHDPGELDLTGGLVYARYGKGTYIFTGLAFFRQLPEGVPGAYRLFVNLLSASRQR